MGTYIFRLIKESPSALPFKRYDAENRLKLISKRRMREGDQHYFEGKPLEHLKHRCAFKNCIFSTHHVLKSG